MATCGLLCLLCALAGGAPDEAVEAVLRETPAEVLVPALEQIGAALTSWDLPGLPDLGTREPEPSPLRRWFLERGVTDSRTMLRTFAEGLLLRARGGTPDWEALAGSAAEAELRRLGPPVRLPVVAGWTPPDKDGLASGVLPFVFVTVTAGGDVWLDGRVVVPADLPGLLFERAEAHRDDRDPSMVSSLMPILRLDAATPWARVIPVLESLRDQALRLVRVGFAWYDGPTDRIVGASTALLPPDTRGARAGEAPRPIRRGEWGLRAALDLAAILAKPGEARVRFDPGFSAGFVCEAIAALDGACPRGVTVAP